MHKSFSLIVLALAGMASTGTALAQSATEVTLSKPILVAATRTEQPVMSYEVASMIQLLHKAQTQYRRSGQAQDLARVEATRRELAIRGYGRATQTAPVMMAQSGSMQGGGKSLRVSLAD